MSLSSTTSRNDYVGNNTTATYAYGFKIFLNTELLVTKDVAGVLTTLALTTDYTVTGVGETAGGNVVLVAGNLATGSLLTIRRKRAIKQLTDIRNGGEYYRSNQEDDLDKVIMIDLQQQDEIDRSMKLPETVAASGFDTALPADIADNPGASFIVNAAGDGLILGPTADEISGAAASATAAAGSATAAGVSATAASGSATAAGTSASNAAAALASAFFRDVVYLTSASSPYTVAQADNGKLFDINSSAGAIAITLPGISGLSLPFNVAFKLTTAGNNVTISRSVTDTINGATSLVLSAAGTGAQLAADTDGSPDNWSGLDFGTLSNASVTQLTLDNTTTSSSSAPLNLSLACSVASNALTINLNDAAGSGASAAAPVRIPFRSATAATGTYSMVSITGALSVVVSSGSTLGHRNGISQYIYVYAINNAGTVELAVSSRLYDDGSILSTVAEGGAGAADAPESIYSTTLRAGVAARLIGRLTVNQTTAGTWAALPSEISLWPFQKVGANSGYVRLYTGNGFGSTNTKIRKFSTVSIYSGAEITYANTAADGASFTLNTPGVYAISYSDEGTSGAPGIGITLNSANLTTDVNLVSDEELLIITSVGTGNERSVCSYTGRFSAGDVIRAHTNTGTAGFQSAAAGARFAIVKVSE